MIAVWPDLGTAVTSGRITIVPATIDEDRQLLGNPETRLAL